jgi:hypothetical protein
MEAGEGLSQQHCRAGQEACEQQRQYSPLPDRSHPAAGQSTPDATA